MISRGLSEEGWQELVISREKGPNREAGNDPAGLGDVKTLTLLLAKLGETIDQARVIPIAEALNTLADETHREMESLVAKTEKKISSLRQILDNEASADPNKPDILTRKQLLEFIAEIGQELSQPLTVVSATIEMLRAQRAGILTEAQGELLNMTFDSTAHLSHLVSCLIKVSGNPKTRQPDEIIRGALNERSAQEP
jgi:signal transduction histidine kinase